MPAEREMIIERANTPWDGFGTRIETPMTSKEAMIEAGLDWNVELNNIIVASDDDINITTHKAVIRPTDNHVLGIVGNKYQPVQNIEAFEFMDSLVHDGLMQYEIVGSHRDGKMIWLLGKIGQFDVVPGDKVNKYIFLLNSHDGTSALRCFFTSVRVWCQNMIRHILSKHAKDGVRLHHTKNIREHMTEAKEVLGFANENFNQFESTTKYLSTKQINTDRLEKFVETLFPIPQIILKQDEDKVPHSIEKARNKVTELFETGVGNSAPNIRGTGWAALNAVTEYANYYRTSKGTSKQERRFEYTMFGSGVNLIDKAQNLLVAA